MAGGSAELRANNWTAFSKLDGTCGFGGKGEKNQDIEAFSMLTKILRETFCHITQVTIVQF